MKSLIVYYSYSGNTRHVAQTLKECLAQQGESTLLELTSLDESKSFFGQCRRAFSKVRAKIAEMNFDVSGHDKIYIGTPVWAFKPAPAMNTFLDKCAGLGGKEVILFTTYGSGTGNERCLRYMREIIIKKGAKRIGKFSIQQGHVKDKEFVIARIKEIV